MGRELSNLQPSCHLQKQRKPSKFPTPASAALERKEELKALRQEAERLDKAQLVDWLMDELERGMRLQLQLEGGAC